MVWLSQRGLARFGVAALPADFTGALAGAFAGAFTDLLMQYTKCFKNTVVQVTPKDKGKYDRSQSLSRAALHSRTWRYHTALEPGKALPFAPLNLKVFFQRAQ